MTTPLHLVRLILDRRALLRLGARHHLGQEVDEGALLHAGLAQLFATSSAPAAIPLHNFAVDDLRASSTRLADSLFLLAYSSLERDSLTGAMGPSARMLLRDCETRKMPPFEAGQRLGFRTRTCPIVRTRKPGDRLLGTDRRGRVKHREMDAFVHATIGLDGQNRVDRERVYEQWLRAQLQRQGASTLERARLTEFRRETMQRRGNVRLERPNAVLEGTLRVQEPVAFRSLLVRGIGRHRAFGFGMLLLRPPES